MDACWKHVNGRPLASDVKDLNFGVGHATAEPRLGIRLVFYLTVAFERPCVPATAVRCCTIDIPEHSFEDAEKSLQLGLMSCADTLSEYSSAFGGHALTI